MPIECMKRTWLAQYRYEMDMTQTKLAELVGVNPHYISMIESGKRGANLPVYTAKRIAKVLNFDWQKFYE